MEFKCERCGRDFMKKKYLIAHLKKTIECDCTYSDVSREILSQSLNKNTKDSRHK